MDKRLTIDIDDTLKKQIKFRVLELGKSIKEYITDLVQKDLSNENEQKEK